MNTPKFFQIQRMKLVRNEPRKVSVAAHHQTYRKHPPHYGAGKNILPKRFPIAKS